MKKEDFRIILVCCLRPPDSVFCTYRVYMADGGFVDFKGFDQLPRMVKDFICDRNDKDHVFTACTLISGCSLDRGC